MEKIIENGELRMENENNYQFSTVNSQLNIPQIRFPEFKDVWREKKLGDFLTLSLNPVPKPKDNYLSIGIRSHFKGTFQKPNTDPNKNAMDTLYSVKENDLLVNITFAWEGAIAIVTKEDEGGLVSHRFPTYDFDKEKVTHIFFKYLFFRSKFKHELGIISPGGAGRNRVLNKSDFLKLKCLFPTLPEQKRIAHFFTVLDNKINQLKEKKALLEEYKKGMMQKIFSQEIRFKDENGNDYPDWEEKRLGEIGEFKNGINKSSKDFGFGYPFINLMDVFGKPTISKQKFGLVNANENELKQYEIKKGDVFFIRSSVKKEGVGETTLILNDLKNTVYSGFLIRFRDNKLKLDLNYKKYCFSNRKFREDLISLSTTSANTNINQESLNVLNIHLPSIPEQAKIANFLSKIDDKINTVNEQIEETKEYKKGLLQRMYCV